MGGSAAPWGAAASPPPISFFGLAEKIGTKKIDIPPNCPKLSQTVKFLYPSQVFFNIQKTGRLIIIYQIFGYKKTWLEYKHLAEQKELAREEKLAKKMKTLPKLETNTKNL